MLSDIKFTLVPFKEGWYWSKKSHKMVWIDDIGMVVWEAEDLPVRTYIMSFPDVVEFIKKNPGDCKKHRNAILRILSERFPLKDRVGIEKWDGVVYVDLDLHNSIGYGKLTDEQNRKLYDALDYALQNIAPNNYFYIEHSSNDNGMHIMFYFDCEPTQLNHDRYCKFIYDIFRYKIDDYIKDFSYNIFENLLEHENASGKLNVFDSVYERPYQKLYITTKDMIMHDVDGCCDDIEVDFVEKQKEDDKINGTFDAKFITGQRRYNTNYYDRLYVLTALKKYVGDKEKCRALWYKFCEQITLYKNYKIKDFKNMFDQNWDGIDEKTGHLVILKKYGFKVDEKKLNLFLKDNEYISDFVEDIINFSDNGINMLISGTGTGKTEVWKKIHEMYSEALEFQYHRPVLVVEPMNSVIESKYDPETFVIVKGGKSLINMDYSTYKCVITNYNHMIVRDYKGFKLMDNIDDFFSKFELIIIDESHILMKDMFRSDVLIPFMQTLNKIKSTKVIIQTATPLFEDSLLNINKKIIVNKRDKRNVKVIYRKCADDRFNIGQIICLTNYYIQNGKKVYIYWKDGSLNNMKFLKKIFPDSMIIYHKRDSGSEDMIKINTEHMLGDCNLMISSVYFGVGNDLNDQVEDAAVIIIGNNIWQEDIQADGRWRNAKNVEICIVLLPHELESVNAGLKKPFNMKERYDKIFYNYKCIYEDVLNRDKSITIDNKSWQIKDKSYIDFLSNMRVAVDYSSQLCIKNAAFRKLGYDVRDDFETVDDIKPLITNADWEAELKAHRNDIKGIRNMFFRNCLDGNYDWNEINKDSTMERCAKIIKKMQNNNLLKYCNMDKFVKKKILNYGIFIKYYEKSFLHNYEFAELYSILWTRKKIIECEDLKAKCKFNDVEVNMTEYYVACGYLIWTYYRDIDNSSTEDMKSFYFSDFIKTVDSFVGIEDELINRIFVKTVYNENYNQFMEEFLGSKIDKEEDVTEENLVDHIMRLSINDKHLYGTMTMMTDYFKNHEVKGRAGGKISKKCVVTEQFKHPEKYKLEIGMSFKSVSDLELYTGKSRKTIAQWRCKKWIT